MSHYGVAIISTIVGLGIGILLATCVFFYTRICRKRPHFPLQSNRPPTQTPIDSSSGSFSDASTVSSVIQEIPRPQEHRSWFTRENRCADNKSKQGIPIFPYKDIEKATVNFTTILGQGSFGPVYKATMPGGEVAAVKVLASDSTQGEREFQTEVDLLSRLHHRNLVNLVGYCVDKGHRMLIYQFMSNGSLESHLYCDDLEDSKILSWEQRIEIILDVCHGIEYLHEGAVPAVMHRDLKPANILLDESMRAKVADFGLSKEQVRPHRHKSGLKGTYGYMDPNYISSNRFTTKSDIYSLGLIIFELICAINPQQGLQNYIDLCSMSEDENENADWEDIVDKKLEGKCDPYELRILGDVALKCLHKTSKKRPSVEEIILTISKIKQRQLAKKGIPQILQRIETQQKQLQTKTMKKIHVNVPVE